MTQGITQVEQNILVRDRAFQSEREGFKDYSAPHTPTDATEWGNQRILALPSSISGWAGLLTRNVSCWTIALKLLEVAAFEAQFITGLGVFLYLGTGLFLWKNNRDFRGRVLGRLSPLVVLIVMVFAGEYLTVNSPESVMQKQTPIEQVNEDDGVG